MKALSGENSLQERFASWAENREEPVAGRIGWFCSYTPVEVIAAAGFTPYRVTGKEGKTPRADCCLAGNLCPYARSCLEAVLDESGTLFDGVVFVRSCNAMIHAANALRSYAPEKFVWELDLPRTASPGAVAYYSLCIERMAESLEVRYGRRVTRYDLWEAILEQRELRRLLDIINSRRKERQPHLSGATAAEIMRLSAQYPPGRVREVLSLLIENTGKTEKGLTGKPRLLLVGTHVPFSLVSLVEESGGLVVGEDACNGLRLYTAGYPCEDGRGAPGGDDPFEYLAWYYLNKPPCPRMEGAAVARRGYLLNVIRDCRVDGVIYHGMKFCDTGLFEFPSLKKFLDGEGIPLLRLEGDYTAGAGGQWKTRVEAFLEMM